MKQGVCILGSTGSVGSNTLKVIALNAEKYEVLVLTANSNVEKMLSQCLAFQPKLAIMSDENAARLLAERLKAAQQDILVHSGEQALNSAAEFVGVEIVVAAIVGAAGLQPTLNAVNKGLKILLANKEALVMSGELFTDAVEKSGAVLLPVDSEHNAIFQCLPNIDVNARSCLSGIDKILLTGSGGPFRTLPLEELSKVTPEQACAHPNWDMGRKISVDSATMMNKGLELIEACFLFAIDLQQLQIVVHPQSIVHSMVSYKDGSVLAQMGNPDMCTPIAHCLGWPQRLDAGVKPLDFYNLSNLSFEAPDFERFPCLKLAMRALELGGTAPCTLNAANEVAVAAFLDRQINFTDIPVVIERTINSIKITQVNGLEDILAADLLARTTANQLISQELRVKSSKNAKGNA